MKFDSLLMIIGLAGHHYQIALSMEAKGRSFERLHMRVYRERLCVLKNDMNLNVRLILKMTTEFVYVDVRLRRQEC